MPHFEAAAENARSSWKRAAVWNAKATASECVPNAFAKGMPVSAVKCCNESSLLITEIGWNRKLCLAPLLLGAGLFYFKE